MRLTALFTKQNEYVIMIKQGQLLEVVNLVAATRRWFDRRRLREMQGNATPAKRLTGAGILK